MAHLKLLPPILEASLPAFIYNTDTIEIPFSMPNAQSQKLIGHKQARIVYAVNNKSVIRTDTYPDGIIYKVIEPGERHENGNLKYHTMSINTVDLLKGWEPGVYYKVQIRFGTSDTLWGDNKNFAKWKSTEAENGNFSEWSTVMIIKPIDNPTVEILNNFNNSSVKNSTAAYLETSTTPLFIGGYSCPVRSVEKLLHYKFVLYDEEDVEIEDSGWLLNNNYDSQLSNTEQVLADYVSGGGSVNDNIGVFLNNGDQNLYAVNYHRFNTLLINNHNYKVIYYIKTENGFETNYKYEFNVQEQLLSELEGITLKVDSTSFECTEEGIIRVLLDSDRNVTGNYVLSRLSEKDDYTTATLLHYINVLDHRYNDELIYEDYTIESGIRYKYILQQENGNGLRSPALYNEGRLSHYVDFQYAYLYSNGVQLKLKYDNTMNSFKHTELASKLDTIGGKYPVIFKNSYAHYAEFPINATITLNLDENEKFFKSKSKGLYYKDELVIPIDKYIQPSAAIAYTRDSNYPIINGSSYAEINTFNTNLTNNNIFIERKFREKVEEFLQGDDYKLYKSPTEGNILVSLINVSMAPKDNLGRMIYSFSATAYEVMEFNMINMLNYGLIETGDFVQDLNGEDNTLLMGQISGLFRGVNEPVTKTIFVGNSTPVSDIYYMIRNENEHILDNGGTGAVYEYKFLKLNSIWIEPYPKRDFSNDKMDLSAQIHTLEGKMILTKKEKAELKSLQEEYDTLEKLEKYIEEQQTANPQISLLITTTDGKTQEIFIPMGRVYSLRHMDVISIKLKYSAAIMVNYTCEVDVEEAASMIDKSTTTTTSWDQIAGIFTETGAVLNNYDYYRNYKDGELLPEDEWELEVEDLQTYNTGLYQSKNILDIIKERTKEMIERLYNTEFTDYDEVTQEWNDGSVYYTFGEIISIRIEADPGTKIRIGKGQYTHTQGGLIVPEDKLSVIGDTAMYILKPSQELIQYVYFENPTHAIIDFKCRTVQKEKGLL